MKRVFFLFVGFLSLVSSVFASGLMENPCSTKEAREAAILYDPGALSNSQGQFGIQSSPDRLNKPSGWLVQGDNEGSDEGNDDGGDEGDDQGGDEGDEKGE